MKLAEGTFQGLHPDEVALFRAVLKGVKGIGVEIGCLDGFSSAVILEASDLHLTSIDPFVPDSMEPSLIGSDRRYFANTEPWAHRRGLIALFSHQAFLNRAQATSKPIDFLFIDGDHRYEEVLQDFSDWTPLLKPGGLLAMHDARMSRSCTPNFHVGPSRVAKEQVFSKPDEWEIVGEAFSLVIALKK